jgi:hypothetical protein
MSRSTHLLQTQLAVDEQGRRLHHRGDRLLVEDLRMQRFRKQVEQTLATHDTDRLAVLDDREGQLLGIVTKQIGDFGDAHIRWHRRHVVRDMFGEQRRISNDGTIERFHLL